MCTIETITLPVSGANTDTCSSSSIKIFKIRPNSITETSKNNTAYVWAHGGGAILFYAEMFNNEMCRMACESNCIVFSVDYRKAPEYKCPIG